MILSKPRTHPRIHKCMFSDCVAFWCRSPTLFETTFWIHDQEKLILLKRWRGRGSIQQQMQLYAIEPTSQYSKLSLEPCLGSGYQALYSWGKTWIRLTFSQSLCEVWSTHPDPVPTQCLHVFVKVWVTIWIAIAIAELCCKRVLFS